jgi:hypothetical protein
MRCPSCGLVNSSEALVCSSCQSPLIEDSQACDSCGAENSHEAKFCKSCGFALGTEFDSQSIAFVNPLDIPLDPNELNPGEDIGPRTAWQLVNDSYRAVWFNFWGFFRLVLLLVTISIPLTLIPIMGPFISAAISAAAVTIATLMVVSVEDVSVFRCVRAGLRKFVPILGVTALSGLVVMALFLPGLLLATSGNLNFMVPMMIALGIPIAIYLSVRWVFLVQVVIAEESGILQAFNRSAILVRGVWWGIFGRSLLMGFVTLTIVMIFLGILVIASQLVPLLQLPVFGLAAVGAPFIYVWQVFTTLLYIDTCARHEGYKYANVNQALSNYE